MRAAERAWRTTKSEGLIEDGGGIDPLATGTGSIDFKNCSARSGQSTVSTRV
jgi:hypothetical protein